MPFNSNIYSSSRVTKALQGRSTLFASSHGRSRDKLTVEYFQGVELLLTLEVVHEDGDVVARLHFDGPGAGLGVEVVARVTRAEDDPRRLRADFAGWALC